MMGSHAPLGFTHALQSSAADLALALSSLPAPLRDLSRAPIVSVVTGDDASVPEEVAAKIRSAGRWSIPSATMLHDDGRVQVAIGAVGLDLSHEMIHVAQVFASRQEMAKALSSVADRGDRVLAAVDEKRAAGFEDKHFRDVVDTLAMTASGSKDAEGHMSSWDMMKDMFHHSGTRELALKRFGLDAQETGAAIFAAGLRRAGFDDPSSNVSRELVAYSYQRDPMQIASLFEDALPKAMAARPTPPRQGEFSLDEARAAVAALPDAKDGAVPLWVTKRDLDILTIRNAEGLKEPFLKALLAVLPAIRQPSFDVAGGKMVRNGKHDLGHQGALALFQGFGDNSTRRRLWLDGERLAHRLVHLETGGKAVFEAASKGSLARAAQRASQGRQVAGASR